MDWNFHHRVGGLEKAVKDFRNHSSKPLSVEIKNPEELNVSIKLQVRHIRFKTEVLPSIDSILSLVPKDTKTEIIGFVSPAQLTI